MILEIDEKLLPYPYYKKVLWRFVRSGISGGASTLLAAGIVLQADLSNWKVYVASVGAGFVGGFITAFFMAVRDYFSEGNKAAAIEKLPL